MHLEVAKIRQGQIEQEGEEEESDADEPAYGEPESHLLVHRVQVDVVGAQRCLVLLLFDVRLVLLHNWCINRAILWP